MGLRTAKYEYDCMSTRIHCSALHDYYAGLSNFQTLLYTTEVSNKYIVSQDRVRLKGPFSVAAVRHLVEAACMPELVVPKGLQHRLPRETFCVAYKIRLYPTILLLLRLLVVGAPGT